jgi:hypothetical protein
MDETPINTSVTPSLHPHVISAIEGFEHDAALLEAHRAFRTAYEAIGSVAAAREGAGKNPEWNEAAQLLAVADYAERKQQAATLAFDRAHTTLANQIALLERTLTTPLTTSAAQPLAPEIRDHVRSLSVSKRNAFLNGAIQVGDTQTLGAVLGAPPYLTGLQPAEVSLFTRRFNELSNPDGARRLASLQRALELVEARGPLIWSGVVKAIGAPWDKVNSLREEKAKATKALA